ncbi:MAG: phage tail protein [Marinisporobacter sp.]|nr:phage tail protein [Marinisporobacter sp.]
MVGMPSMPKIPRIPSLAEIQNMLKSDPVGKFKFMVMIGPELRGNFARVSGIESEIVFEEYREGGVNTGVHYLPTQTRHSRLVLERGIMNINPLEVWYMGVQTGAIAKLGGLIMLMNSKGKPVKIWAFKGAYPVKYVGPDLDANSSEVAVTKIEIIHDGLITIPIPV